MDKPALNRSLKSHIDQAARQERELQKMVWPNARPSAAQALYPALARRDAALPQQQTAKAATNSSAGARLWPRLKRG